MSRRRGVAPGRLGPARWWPAEPGTAPSPGGGHLAGLPRP